MKLKKQPAEHHAEEGRWMRDVILGANDGFVSILGLVSGVAAATHDSKAVVLAGVAGAIAAAISMALGNYISIKSQMEVYNAEIEREKREIRELPEVEEQEIRELYAKKGFRGRELEMVVNRITSDEKVWLQVMMEEELGLKQESMGAPVKSAAFTGVAFAIAAAFPIAPFLLMPAEKALLLSVVFTLIALFAVGAAKTFFTKSSALKSGIEMVAVGAAASAVTYVIGSALGVEIS